MFNSYVSHYQMVVPRNPSRSMVPPACQRGGVDVHTLNCSEHHEVMTIDHLVQLISANCVIDSDQH